MTNESNESARTTSSTPSSPKDEQDQVFGREAEQRKRAAETGGAESAEGTGRPPEPHAGGKA